MAYRRRQNQYQVDDNDRGYSTSVSLEQQERGKKEENKKYQGWPSLRWRISVERSGGSEIWIEIVKRGDTPSKICLTQTIPFSLQALQNMVLLLRVIRELCQIGKSKKDSLDIDFGEMRGFSKERVCLNKGREM